MNGVFDALVTAAAADVARHRLADLVVRGFGVLAEQRSRLHDLTNLAEAALRHVELAPGFLHRMVAGGVKAFNGGDLAADHVGDGGDAGAHRFLPDEAGAGTPRRLAAAIFGAGQPSLITEKPEKGKVRVAVPAMFL